MYAFAYIDSVPEFAWIMRQVVQRNGELSKRALDGEFQAVAAKDDAPAGQRFGAVTFDRCMRTLVSDLSMIFYGYSDRFDRDNLHLTPKGCEYAIARSELPDNDWRPNEVMPEDFYVM